MLPGKPDIVLTKFKIAIFCDGEFFHGKDWEMLKSRLLKSKNSKYWIDKISRNIERDDEINKKLLFQGWTVIRFWGKDIRRNVEIARKQIKEGNYITMEEFVAEMEEKYHINGEV